MGFKSSEEEKLFNELSREHVEWITQAIERGGAAMAFAIVAAANVEGAVRIGVSKDIFLREMTNGYDRATIKVHGQDAEKN